MVRCVVHALLGDPHRALGCTTGAGQLFDWSSDGGLSTGTLSIATCGKVTCTLAILRQSCGAIYQPWIVDLVMMLAFLPPSQASMPGWQATAPRQRPCHSQCWLPISQQHRQRKASCVHIVCTCRITHRRKRRQALCLLARAVCKSLLGGSTAVCIHPCAPTGVA